MKRQTRTTVILGLAGGLTAMGLGLSSWAKGAPNGAPVPRPNPQQPQQARQPMPEGDRIQIAILLDTSSSMDGLIEQAKSQLWRVVNEFATAKRQGKRPRIELALYEYGKSTISADKGYIRQIVPFTRDLDKVSEELFALGTNGGEEWAGMVIRDASKELAWSKDPVDLKLMFIAGNEGFDQGPVAFRAAIAQAREQGIVINTIYCGDPGDGIGALWREGAQLAAGSFTHIDHNAKVVAIATPYDDEINRLGVELNGTYVAYGRAGAMKKERQAKQDANASAVAQGASTERSVSKAGAGYRNDDWDLVDGEKSGAVAVDRIAEEELPPEMKAMTPDQRKAYVAGKAADRARIQKRIAELDGKRRAFIETERKKGGASADATLDAAMGDMVQKSAKAAGYSF